VKPRSLLAALCLLVASCAYVEATTTQYVGVPRFAPVEPAAVQVLRGEPPERHDRLGEVLLDISVEPPALATDVEAKLRVEAAAMGGNAIYVARDVVVPGVGRKLVGIVIRYRQ
jgi:hypothetical protein